MRVKNVLRIGSFIQSHQKSFFVFVLTIFLQQHYQLKSLYSKRYSANFAVRVKVREFSYFLLILSPTQKSKNTLFTVIITAHPYEFIVFNIHSFLLYYYTDSHLSYSKIAIFNEQIANHFQPVIITIYSIYSNLFLHSNMKTLVNAPPTPTLIHSCLQYNSCNRVRNAV